MENNKKFNKLSIIAFVLSLIVPIQIILSYWDIYLLPFDFSIQKYIYIPLFSIGFILSRISMHKIKKNGEKGKGLNYVSLAAFTFILGFIVIIYIFSNQGYKKSENVSIKSTLASMRAQAVLFYESNNESYLGVCDAAQINNGFGGVNGPGLLSNAVKYSYKGKIKCLDDKDSWVVSAEFKDKPKKNDHYYGYNYFCSDSMGSSKAINKSQNDSIINADTLCVQ